MIKTAVEYDKGPIALRYPRGESIETLDSELKDIPIGKSEIVQEGEIAAIFAIGSTVYPSLQAAMILKNHGLNVSVINARFVKPLDEKLIAKIVDKHNYIITVEENVLAGGFGSAVIEYLTDNNYNQIKVRRIGLPDSFIEQGDQSILKANYGLTPEKIAETIEYFLHQEQSKHHAFI
jgi:1-deoxy-D-xylulose-5-phosphate synthase